MGLDSSWDRKLDRAALAPDFTLDLHGHTLDAAFRALGPFLRSARDDGARVVEIVTGHGRLTGGGAIRRELPHWLNRPELRPLVVAARPSPWPGRAPHRAAHAPARACDRAGRA